MRLVSVSWETRTARSLRAQQTLSIGNQSLKAFPYCQPEKHNSTDNLAPFRSHGHTPQGQIDHLDRQTDTRLIYMTIRGQEKIFCDVECT